MAVTISGRYMGNKRVELVHEPTGTKIITDAPKDNQGEGRAFSPTDLAAGSLGACLLTIMAIVGERSGIQLDGACFELEKHMNEDPRRIGKIPVKIHLPAALTPAQRSILQNAVKACPVHRSLHPEIDITIEFLYDI